MGSIMGNRVISVAVGALTLAFLLAAGAGRLPSQEPAGQIPDAFVGKWVGGLSWGWSNSSAQVGTAAVVTQFGHSVDQFEFEVAKDGTVTGTGAATYRYNVSTDAHLIASRVVTTAQLDGKTQQVNFNISGKLTPDGKLVLESIPRKLLTLVNAGKQETMAAWNVFGGIAGVVEIERHIPTVETFGVVTIDGKNTKIGWSARKQPNQGSAPHDEPVSPGPPGSDIPRMYVGQWTGGRGKATSVTRGQVGRSWTTKDLGHQINNFEFKVAKDGTVTGTGTATYWFDISSDIDMNLIAMAPEAHLDKHLQHVDFTITGQVSGDATVELSAEPRKGLTLINSGDKSAMGAWNVFGGVVGKVERGDQGLVVRASDTVDPKGLKMKLDWKAKKKLKLLEITSLKLNDIDDLKLAYLSAAYHEYFQKNTRVHGTITITGPKEESLHSLLLQVVQKGNVVAVGDLAEDLRSQLLNVPFGPHEKLEVKTSKLLYELLATEAAKVDGKKDGKLTLRAKARATDGQETTKDYGEVEILVRYTNTNRIPGSTRDPEVGGDDWVKPSVKPVVEHFAQFTWNDFSNMNGGPFKPHKSHNTGNDVDGYFNNYEKIDAAAAQTLIDALNDGTNGERITNVFVSFKAWDEKDADGNIIAHHDAHPEFQATIDSTTLNRGVKASAVITHEPNHNTHFHFRISDEPPGT
jgi:hypothetical protein